MAIQVVDKFGTITGFSYAKQMKEICSPLSKIGIECFSYFEYKGDSLLRWLITDVTFLELWNEHARNCFSNTVFSNKLTDNSGVYFLDSLYRVKPPCLTPEFFDTCAVATGAAIVEHEPGIKRVYIFATNDSVKFHANYHQLQKLFYQFTEYFKKEARALINRSNYYLIPKEYLANAQRLEYPKLLLNDDIQSFLTAVVDKNHPLERIATDYQLTKREQQCLSQLLRGASAKKVAEKMDISLRTAENHIQNIRKKTQSPSIKDLIIKLAYVVSPKKDNNNE